MKHYIVKIVLALAFAVLVYAIGVPACSPTRFGSLSCEEFSDSFDGTCSPQPLECTPFNPLGCKKNELGEVPEGGLLGDEIQYTYTFLSNQIDILFVVDNSSSMAKEHRSLASQFKNFLNDIKDLDYHIAVTTTDISASPENPVRNAPYQDGRFISIGSRTFLQNESIGSKASQRVIEDFQNALVREETRKCDDYYYNRPTRGQRTTGNQYDQLYAKDNQLYTKDNQLEGNLYDQPDETASTCPSHDERGTYAINLSMDYPHHQTFFRPKAHLMLVIISDEDIRSSEDYRNQRGYEQYALETRDYPEALIEKLYYTFKAKSLSFHSIIIKPYDRACFNKQNSNSQGQGKGRGFYGKEYARLSKAYDSELIQYGNLVPGNLISICDRSYGTQLSRVALFANTLRVSTPCENPQHLRFYVNDNIIHPEYQIEGRTLIIEPGRINLGATTITLKLTCKEN